jgi:hypothetical protein
MCRNLILYEAIFVKSLNLKTLSTLNNSITNQLMNHSTKFPPQKTQSQLWSACWIILTLLTLSPFYEDPPTIIASFMKVSAHLEVAFVFCWIIIADKLNYRNAFIRFLSKRSFAVAGKTTYSMYLITPIIVTLISGLTRGGLTYDFPDIVNKPTRRFIHSIH